MAVSQDLSYFRGILLVTRSSDGIPREIRLLSHFCSDFGFQLFWFLIDISIEISTRIFYVSSTLGGFFKFTRHLISNGICKTKAKKYSFISGAPGDENKSHAGGRKNIFWKYVAINIVENWEFYFFGSLQDKQDKHVSNSQRPT